MGPAGEVAQEGDTTGAYTLTLTRTHSAGSGMVPFVSLAVFVFPDADRLPHWLSGAVIDHPLSWRSGWNRAEEGV